MSTIYLISVIYEIEDYYRASSPVVAKTTEDEAKATIAQLKATHEKKHHMCKRVIEYIEKWEATIEKPKSQELEIAPRWPAGLSEHQITPEMREERDGIIARNSVIIDKTVANRLAHSKAEEEAAKTFAAANGIPEECIVLNSWWDSKYCSPDVEYKITPIELDD